MLKLQQLIQNKRAFEKSMGARYRIKRVPQLHHPIAFEADYAKYLKTIVDFVARQMKEKLIPRLPFLTRSASVIRADEYTDDLNEIFRTIRATLGAQFTDDQIRQALKSKGLRIANWNKKQLTAALTAALSVDVYAAEPWLASALNGFIHTNVSLIESITRDQLRDAELRISSGIRQGMRVEELAKQIQGEFGVNAKAKNRAELIARDQIGKFNGDLNHMRQKELGIEKYIWRTVRDERVRPTHAELDGTTQRWDAPPVTEKDGSRNHPGEDFQCRCQAEPVLDF
jgi:SPP1 gp7 family putative phage head morphogenesis protein